MWRGHTSSQADRHQANPYPKFGSQVEQYDPQVDELNPRVDKPNSKAANLKGRALINRCNKRIGSIGLAHKRLDAQIGRPERRDPGAAAGAEPGACGRAGGGASGRE